MDSPHTIIIISTLLSLTNSSLSHSISALLLRRRRRLAALLSSPDLFSFTLLHLQSLSLHHKSLLVAHHLFSNLTFLKSLAMNHAVSPPSNLRDLDSALLLLLLCEVDHHDRHLLDAPPSHWRFALRDYFSDSILRISSLGGGGLLEFVESVGRCWNLVDVMCCSGEKEVAVAALPSVEVRKGSECAICKEEMGGEGSEVCELPCRHLFHWGCILLWFGKGNTCPCCRHRLPTGDVRCEIRRLLEDLAEIAGERLVIES